MSDSPDETISEIWINDLAENNTSSDTLPEIWRALFNNPILSDIVADVIRCSLSLQDACLGIIESKLRHRLIKGNVTPDSDIAECHNRFILQTVIL